MRAAFLGLMIGLGWLGLSGRAIAQAPPGSEIAELRREIAQAKAMIAKWQTDLAALEQRLSRIDARLSATSYLRFPWDVERAMIGEGMERSRRFVELPRQRGQSRGELFPNGSTVAPGLPRR